MTVTELSMGYLMLRVVLLLFLTILDLSQAFDQSNVNGAINRPDNSRTRSPTSVSSKPTKDGNAPATPAIIGRQPVPFPQPPQSQLGPFPPMQGGPPFPPGNGGPFYPGPGAGVPYPGPGPLSPGLGAGSPFVPGVAAGAPYTLGPTAGAYLPSGPAAPAPFPNWQGSFLGPAGMGPPNMLAANNFGNWPPPIDMSGPPPLRGAQPSPQLGSGFPQSPAFLPQPSQWPFVETAGPPPAGGPENFGWPPGPGMPNSPWPQGLAPAIFSQWLPSALGSAALPPSPPWGAPGTIMGGPQLSPQGPWTAAPVAHNPASTNSQPSSGAVPEYIRSGYDAVVNAAQVHANRNNNASASAHRNQNVDAGQKFIILEPQAQNLVPAYTAAELEWLRTMPAAASSLALASAPVAAAPADPRPAASYAYPPNNQPADGSQSFDTPAYRNSGGSADYTQYFIQPANDAGPALAAAPLTRVRDPQALPAEGALSYGRDSKSQPELITTSPSPTTAQTDDPFAFNPNIVFGGPASVVFPELTVGASQALSANESGLSVSSIRVGDILSFPQGTGFGVIPPPPPPVGKRVAAFSNKMHADDVGVFTRSSGKVEKAATATGLIKVIPIGATASADPGRLGSLRLTTEAAKGSDPNPEVQLGQEGILKPQQTVTFIRSVVNVSNEEELMETILKQIQDLKVVLYGRPNCTVCLETETLLKNYSTPVYYFELDAKSDANAKDMLNIMQQMTHSLEMPLTFICGRFVGGHQRMYDLHVNQQVTSLLRECTPSKSRAALRKNVP